MAHIKMNNYSGIKYPDILQIMQNGQFINGFMAAESIAYADTSYGIVINRNYRGIYYRREATARSGRTENYYIQLSNVNELYPKFLTEYTKLNVTFRTQDGRAQPHTNRIVYLDGTQLYQAPADSVEHTYNYTTSNILGLFRLYIRYNTDSSNKGQITAMIGNMFLSN